MNLLVLTFTTLLAVVSVEPRGTVRPQERRELIYSATDKQQVYATVAPASASSSALLKVSPQSFSPESKGSGLPATQVLSYNPQQLFSYNPQTVSYVPQTLKYASAPPDLTFGFAPQYQSQSQPQPQHQQQLEYAAQPVAYAPQPVAKVAAAPAVARLAPAAQPAITFSPASEVSSFKFSSPLVTYSNLGVLTQITGKSASAAATAQSQAAHSASAAPAPQPAPQKYSLASIPSAQQYSFAAPQFAYSAAPAPAPAAQKVQYAPAPQQFAFAALPQQFAYAAPAPQKLVYAQQPQAAASSAGSAPASKVVYAQVPQQYISAASSAPQQIAYASPSQQQLAYALAAAAAAPQGAQSASQPSYSLPPQFQYAVPSSKLANSPSAYEQQ